MGSCGRRESPLDPKPIYKSDAGIATNRTNVIYLTRRKLGNERGIRKEGYRIDWTERMDGVQADTSVMVPLSRNTPHTESRRGH